MAGTLEKSLQVPLYQGLLYAAYSIDRLKEEVGGDQPIQNTIVASGYIYSRAILPYIDDKDSDAASIIAKNLNFNTEPEVVDGYTKVFDEVSSVIGSDMCKDIGYMTDAQRGVVEPTVQMEEVILDHTTCSNWCWRS